MKKYKVLQVAGSPSNVSINTKELEEDLNSKAKEGWNVISCTPSNFTFQGTEINRLIIIFEKDE
jgi:translation elongation factor EF-1beta